GDEGGGSHAHGGDVLSPQASSSIPPSYYTLERLPVPVRLPQNGHCGIPVCYSGHTNLCVQPGPWHGWEM
ncbi:hypothetical protein BAE44_0008850, partial [Dichanthelium oligosanthes]